MKSSVDVRKYHAIYQDIDRDAKAAIDAAFDVVVWSLKNDGYNTPCDDRAKELIAAITCYLTEGQS